MSAQTDALNELLSTEPEAITVETLVRADVWVSINGASYMVSFSHDTPPAGAIVKRTVLDALQLLRAEGIRMVAIEGTS